MPEIQLADREAARAMHADNVKRLASLGVPEESLMDMLARHLAAHREAAVDAYIATTTPPEPRALTAEAKQLESAQLAVEGLKRLLADEEREHGNTIDARDAREEDLSAIFVALGMNEAEREWTSMQNPTGIALLAIDELRKDDERTIAISGIMLRRSGDRVIVEAEIDGRWVEVIDEFHDSNFSHIVEPAGMKAKLAALIAAFGIGVGVKHG